MSVKGADKGVNQLRAEDTQELAASANCEMRS